MKHTVSARRRKLEILLCIILILLMGSLTEKMDGMYLNPEDAFWAIEELEGIGPSKKIIYQKESADGERMYFVGLLEPEKDTELMRHVGFSYGQYDTYYSIVVLEKVWDIFWKQSDNEGAYIEYLNQEIDVRYKKNMSAFLVSCRNPDVKEVHLRWGELLENGTYDWTAIHGGSALFVIENDGYFVHKIDEDITEQYDDIQAIYIEGRDKDGSILYRHGIDDEGRRFTFNKEVK